MILVADSGSTKTNWIAINNKGETYFKIDTKGLNPAVFSRESLFDRIITKKELYEIKDDVEKIFFYGAGCGTQKAINYLQDVFKEIFVNADIDIQEDTIAAVKSLQTDQPGVVCILGTGSNCSYFDGKETHQKIVSLGYILMDAASGNFFGKQLLKDYQYRTMPKEISEMFEKQYDLRPDIIKENLYKKDNPNTYLAQVGRFLVENKQSDYAQNILKNGLRFFVENQILQFEQAKDVPIYFVGSIAHFLSDEIREVLAEYDLKLGKIIRHPISTLAQVHASQMA